MLTGIGQIDIFIKQVVQDTVTNYTDPSIYYIKTELDGVYYTLQLFNEERQTTVGYRWSIDTLLAECQSKVVQDDVQLITRRILQRFGDNNLLTGNEINWLQ